MREHILAIRLSERIDFPAVYFSSTDDYLFAFSKQRNCLFDISQITKPALVCEIPLSQDEYGYTKSLLAFVNKKAYFRIGYSGLEVIDFHDIREPRSLGLRKDFSVGGKWS